MQWQGLSFLLKDFVKEEVEYINKMMVQNEVDKPALKDPSSSIQFVLNLFMDWYNHLRQPLLKTEELAEIAQKTYNLQLMLKKLFPQKSGKWSVVY
jgi:hypothetical protein